MKKQAITAILAAVVLMTACGEKTDNVAKVGDNPISKQQFAAYLKYKNIPADDKTRYANALDSYVQREALAAAIEKSGKLDQASLDAEIRELKKQMLISRYFESYLNDSVSDDAIRNYYSNHADQYVSSKVHVAHILFRVTPKMSESERKAVLTNAHEAYSKLQANEPFEEIAKAYSQDKVSAKRGGDLGWINKGAVSPEFSEKAFTLAPGTYTEPFLTAFGFHILKVVEGPQEVKKPLQAVKGDIRYQLRNEAKQAETERLMNTIKVSKGA